MAFFQSIFLSFAHQGDFYRFINLIFIIQMNISIFQPKTSKNG
mgnify:CR=1 FL=1